MHPTLHDDDVVWADPSIGFRDLAVGDLVVVRHPCEPGLLMVKRVSSFGNARFSVSSDNPLEGQDSRHFGPLSDADLVGLVRRVDPSPDQG